MLDNDSLLLLQGVFKITRKAGRQRCITTRNYDILSMRIDGSAAFFSNSEGLTVCKNELLYIPQGVVYRQETEGETILAIHFFNHSSFAFDKLKKIPIGDTPAIAEAFFEMYELWNQKKPGYKYKCTSILYDIVFTLINQSTEAVTRSNPENLKLKTAVDYIHTHYRKDRIAISELAKMASLSESYFRRLFKSVYSVTPGKYITNLRLEYASQLLKTQLYTVAEVSEKSGFTDTKYFERVFKRNFNESPKKHIKS